MILGYINKGFVPVGHKKQTLQPDQVFVQLAHCAVITVHLSEHRLM